MDINIDLIKLAPAFEQWYGLIMSLAVTAVYVYSLAYFTMILRKVDKCKSKFFAYITKYAIVVSFLTVVFYLYLVIRGILTLLGIWEMDIITGHYSLLFLRPIMFLNGGLMAIIGKCFYWSLKEGGFIWIYRKLKT